MEHTKKDGTPDGAQQNGQPTNGAHEAAPEGHSANGYPDTRTFTVSFFPGLTKTNGTAAALTWAQLCKQLKACDVRPDKDGRLISSAIYREGEIYRNKENVVSLSGLWVDCDESHTLAEIRAIIRPLGVRALIFSTHRHGTPDEKEHPDAHAPGERYRVFFPLEELVLVADYPDVWERLNLLFGGEIDAACKDAARAYFLPSHPTGEGFISEVFEGRLLRLSDLPELPPEFHAPSYIPASDAGDGQGRPGDDFNARATNEDTAQILEAHGWRVTRSTSPRWKAKRPGKNGPGISATIGHYGPGILRVFTSSAAPFEAARAYKPFGVLALLDFGGDFKATARALGKRGFGESKKAKGATVAGNFKSHFADDFKNSDDETREIPAPAIRNERGGLEFEAGQLVEILRPGWTCAALSTHAAHAARVLEHIGGDLRFSPQLGWLTFGGRQWERDDRHATQTADRAKELSQVVREEAATLYALAGDLAKNGRGADAEALSRAAASHTKHAKQAETKNFLEGALHFAAGAKQVRVPPDAFDQRPWLLGFQNGVWDAGEWREHRREDFLLNLCPVAFDAKTDRSEWERVLFAITDGGDDFARTLQDAAGYILSGASHLRFLPWLYGPKGTGKSTFAELLQTALGKMAATIDPKKLQDDAARERLGADLWNRRLAVCAEAGGQKLEAELLKTLSGSDTLTVRFLYQEAFDALPRHVLLMVSNDAPRLDAYDDALKDRVVALPFVHRLDARGPLNLSGGARIEAVRKDPNSLLVRGFVAWALEGLARVHQTQSIFRAACIEEATAKFWSDTDPLTPFWETLEEAELRAGISNGDLRGRYEKWCEGEGVRPFRGKAWAKACESRGMVQEHRGGAKDRARFWVLRRKQPEKPKSEQNEQNNGNSQKTYARTKTSRVDFTENSPESVHSVHFSENGPFDGADEAEAAGVDF